MIERRKELCNVKCNNTGLEAFGPARVNQISEKEASIFSGPLSNTTKLVRIKDPMLNRIKLESPSNHLLNKLAKCVEKDSGMKGLGSVVG